MLDISDQDIQAAVRGDPRAVEPLIAAYEM